MNAAAFAAKVRARETVAGYWVTLDAPPATERIARLGYDYVCLDGQHGLFQRRDRAHARAGAALGTRIGW